MMFKLFAKSPLSRIFSCFASQVAFKMRFFASSLWHNPWRNTQQSFSRVPTESPEEADGITYEPQKESASRKLWSALAVISAGTGVALLATSVGFFVGRHGNHETDRDGLLGNNALSTLLHDIWSLKAE
jgi:hypothetical protein